MNTFQVSAKVTNIYGNGEDMIATTYKAENKEKALQGFMEYLKSNRNLISYSDVKIKED